MDFKDTIANLKQNGLIGEHDFAVVCMDPPDSSAYLFGAIGALLFSSKRCYYIVAVNDVDVRLFNIDRKTGAYLNTFIAFQRNELNKLFVGGLNSLVLKTKTRGTFTYKLLPKYQKISQKEEISRLKTALPK